MDASTEIVKRNTERSINKEAEEIQLSLLAEKYKIDTADAGELKEISHRVERHSKRLAELSTTAKETRTTNNIDLAFNGVEDAVEGIYEKDSKLALSLDNNVKVLALKSNGISYASISELNFPTYGYAMPVRADHGYGLAWDGISLYGIDPTDLETGTPEVVTNDNKEKE